MALKIEPIANDDERQWCARLLASNDPWVTLRRNFEACYAALGLESKERFLISEDDVRAGVLILDCSGPFPGYIQTIALAPEARSRGLARRVIAWAEERILRESPNGFMLVSSFNVRAQQLYTSLGYETIGTLRGYIVDEHDELLLRKTVGRGRPFGSGGRAWCDNQASDAVDHLCYLQAAGRWRFDLCRDDAAGQ